MTLEEFNKLSDEEKAKVLNTPEALASLQEEKKTVEDNNAKLIADNSMLKGQYDKMKKERDEAINNLINGVVTPEKSFNLVDFMKQFK